MIRSLLLLSFFARGLFLSFGQDMASCQPAFDMSPIELKTMLSGCPGIRRVLHDNSARQMVLLFKDGRIVTYNFQGGGLYSIEDLWTFSTKKTAEDLFYSIYDHLINLNATPLEFVENGNETRLIAETEEKRFSLFMQDLREPHIIVTLLVEQVQ